MNYTADDIFHFSSNEIWTILFWVLVGVAIMSVLACVISCCYANNCFCSCYERIGNCLCCQDRDLAYEDSVTCFGYSSRRHRYDILANRDEGVFADCCMVQYNTDKHICGCFWKQSVCKNSVCAICLEDFIIGESLTLCPCGHCYHKKCIRGWLRLKNCCPLCKVRVSRRPRVHSERTPLLYDDPLSV